MAEAEKLPNVQAKGRTEVPAYKVLTKHREYVGPEIMDFESVSTPMSPAQLARTKERYLKFVNDRTAELKPQFDLLRKTDSQEKRAALLNDILDRLLLVIWQNLTYEKLNNLIDVFFSIRQGVSPPMKADCDLSAIICGDILQQQGIQVKLVTLHQSDHAILRVIDGGLSVYVETTLTPTVFGNQITHSRYDELEFKLRYGSGHEFDIKAETAYNYFMRSIIFLQNGKIAEAQASASQAMKLDPNYEGSHYALGFVKANLNDFEAAKNYFQAALKLNQRFYEARASLGKTELSLGDSESAEKTAKALLLLNPDKPGGYEIKGAISKQKKQYEEALNFYKKAILLEDDSDNKMKLIRQVNLIQVALRNKSSDKSKTDSCVSQDALEAFVSRFNPKEEDIRKATKEIEDSPNDYTCYTTRGDLYDSMFRNSEDRNERKKYLELALADFEKALELNPRCRIGYDFAAGECSDLYNLTGAEIYKQRAMSYWSEMKENLPDDGTPYIRLGDIFYSIGDYAAAAKEYEDGIKKLKAENTEKSTASALMCLGGAYQKLHRYDDAEKCFQDAPLNVGKVDDSGKMGTVSRAVYYKFREDAKVGLGNLYLEEGKYDKALEFFSKMGLPTWISLYQNVNKMMGYGDVYVAKGEYKKALKYYNKAVKHSEEYLLIDVTSAILAHQKRGDLKLLMGDAEGANKDYDRIAEIIASDKRLLEMFQNGWPFGAEQGIVELGKAIVSVKINQARAHHILGRHQDAISEFQSLLTSNPNDLALLCHLGDSYSAAGNNADAILAYEKAARNNPNFALPHLRLARTYAALGRKEDAKKELARMKYLPNMLYDELGNPATLSFDSAKPDKTSVKKN